MNSPEYSFGQAASSPPNPQRWPWVLLAFNFALIAWPGGRKFIPSEQGILLGFVYGLLCAFYHVQTIRIARRQLSRLAEPDRGAAQQKLKKPWPFIALVQLAIGVAAFADGVGSLYTEALGQQDEHTYIVYEVSRRPNHGRCYKHKFADISWLQNFFGAPCLALEYAPGTRFHYRGRSSSLGFKHDGLEIEIEQPPHS